MTAAESKSSMSGSTLDSQAAIGPLLPRAVLALNECFFRSAGKLYCPYNWWRFASRIAPHFQALTLYVPLACQEPSEDAKLVEGLTLPVEGRPFYRRTEEYYRNVWPRRKALIESATKLFTDCDLVLLRAPSPDALLLAKVAWRLGKKTALLVGGDLVSGTAYASARGLKATVARLMARHLRRGELEIARRSAFVGVWGRELLPIFSRQNRFVALGASPIIGQEHIYRRQDTCQGQSLRLIRVARVLPNKGIEFLLEAVSKLHAGGRPVWLDIVGGADDAAYLAQLNDLSRRLGISSDVQFHGQLEFGQALFDLYRQADVHVVSSLTEGIPRCVAEGRVFGLPTVATKVGGIPSIVHHGIDGLLVEPRSAQQIADALERLWQDGELRRKIIQKGYNLAAVETAQFQARRLAELISQALAGVCGEEAALDIHLMPSHIKAALG